MMDWKKENNKHQTRSADDFISGRNQRRTSQPEVDSLCSVMEWIARDHQRGIQKRWCRENLSGGWSYSATTDDFFFMDDADAVMFALMFGGAA